MYVYFHLVTDFSQISRFILPINSANADRYLEILKDE